MRFLIGLTALFSVVACGSDYGSGPKTNTSATYHVNTIGDAFIPTLGLQIAPNDTVEWSFTGGSDGNGHNVRFTPKVTGAPTDITVQKTGSVRRVFTTKGDFLYACDVHPGMNGEIIVQ